MTSKITPTNQPTLSYQEQQNVRLRSDLVSTVKIWNKQDTPLRGMLVDSKSEPKVYHLINQLLVTETVSDANKLKSTVQKFFKEDQVAFSLDKTNQVKKLNAPSFSEEENSSVISLSINHKQGGSVIQFRHRKAQKSITQPKNTQSKASSQTMPAATNMDLYKLVITSRRKVITNYEQFFMLFSRVSMIKGQESFLAEKAEFIEAYEAAEIKKNKKCYMGFEQKIRFLISPDDIESKWDKLKRFPHIKEDDTIDDNDLVSDVCAIYNDTYTAVGDLNRRQKVLFDDVAKTIFDEDEVFDSETCQLMKAAEWTQSLVDLSSEDSEALEEITCQPIQYVKPVMLPKIVMPEISDPIVGFGFTNFNVTCAFNSLLQAMKFSFFPTAADQITTKKLPESIIYTLLAHARAELQSPPHKSISAEQTKGLNASDEELAQLSKKVATSENQIDELKSLEKTHAFFLLSNHECFCHFINAFFKLCNFDENSKLDNNPKQLLNDFYTCYFNLAKALKRKNSMTLLNAKRSAEQLIPSNIIQVCANELTVDLFDLLGVVHDENSSLIAQRKTKAMLDDKEIKANFDISQPTGLIQAPTPKTQSSLTDCLNLLCEEEHLKDYKWSTTEIDDEIQSKACTLSQLSLSKIGVNYPEKLTVSIKLFHDHLSKAKVSEQTSLGTKDIGILTLCKLIDDNFKVLVPITNKVTKKVGSVPYKVTSVVCHEGSSMHNGHYTTLRVHNNGNITLCDDRKIFSLYRSKSNAKEMAKEEVSALKQKCVGYQLSGYVFFLQYDGEIQPNPTITPSQMTVLI